jgi:hypothetical protein
MISSVAEMLLLIISFAISVSVIADHQCRPPAAKTRLIMSFSPEPSGPIIRAWGIGQVVTIKSVVCQPLRTSVVHCAP